MGLCVLTCLEIYANPKDLEVNIVNDVNTEKFAILICRGPGHKYKTVLTTLPFTNDFDEAIEVAQHIFEGVIEVGKSFISEGVDPSTPNLSVLVTKIEGAEVLNQDILEKMISELRERRTISTHRFLEGYVWGR